MNERMIAFAEHYLQCWNKTEAARRAGYSAKSAYNQGYRLMKNDEISAYLRERLESLQMSADEVLVRLSNQARGNMGDFLQVSEKGAIRIDWKKAEPNLHLVKKFVQKPTEHGMQIEFELYDAQAALVQLGRFHKLFTDRVEVKDWRDEAIDSIRRNEITFEALRDELGDDLAAQLFREAGIRVMVAESQN